MWTEAHRARHEPGLKAVVAACAVEEIAAWLERADPPRSGRATPVRRVVGAIAWHLRVGGPWRALPPGWAPWRTVYGWFRRWLELGLLDALLRDVARRRRRKAGRRPGPTLAIVDTQVVKCIAVRGPRGYDAAKGVVGRKRVALVDAEGHWLAVAVVPASVQDRDTPEALDEGKARWPTLREGVYDGAFAAERCRDWSNRHGMRHCVVARGPRASSCSPAAGWSRGASAGCPTGAASPGTAPAGSTSRPPVSPSSASSPALRLCSTRCRSALPHSRPTQTDGVIGAPDRGVAAPPRMVERGPRTSATSIEEEQP
jgi:putative transposase